MKNVKVFWTAALATFGVCAALGVVLLLWLLLTGVDCSSPEGQVEHVLAGRSCSPLAALLASDRATSASEKASSPQELAPAQGAQGSLRPTPESQLTGEVSWNRYDVSLDVQPNGDLLVTETQALDFSGTFKHAFRDISLDRTTGITDVQVGEPGTPYRPGSTTPNGFTVTNTDSNSVRVDWYFPTTTNGQRTFVLSYRAHGAIRFYSGGDQLYWQAIYADRVGSVRAATITAHLPSDVPRDQLRAEVNPSAVAQRPTFPDARSVVFSVQNLPKQSGLEIRVQFPHGLVAGTPAPYQAQADAEDVRRRGQR